MGSESSSAAASGLAGRLTAEFPTVPLSFVLHAVAQYRRALRLCGDGEQARAVAETTAREDLRAVLAVLQARSHAGAGPAADAPGAAR